MYFSLKQKYSDRVDNLFLVFGGDIRFAQPYTQIKV